MAEDIDVGIRLTPPYGKSVIAVQMRHAIAAMQWSRLHKSCTNLPPRWLNTC
jgi:hypothetical protein